MKQAETASPDGNCNGSVQDLAAMGSDLLSLSIKASTDFVRSAADILTRSPLCLKLPGLEPACRIPETDCPPRCVCRIDWEAARGDRRRHTIRVTNTADADIPFRLSATPFDGPDGPMDLLTLEPDRLVLKPGESGSATASLQISENMASGRYRAEIRVAGRYEQCIEIRLTVREARRSVCEVSQGEIPVRIRAHRWYHHFQCAEPCFRPVHREQDPQRPDLDALKRDAIRAR
jgi:hypothetical protein